MFYFFFVIIFFIFRNNGFEIGEWECQNKNGFKFQCENENIYLLFFLSLLCYNYPSIAYIPMMMMINVFNKCRQLNGSISSYHLHFVQTDNNMKSTPHLFLLKYIWPTILTLNCHNFSMPTHTHIYIYNA